MWVQPQDCGYFRKDQLWVGSRHQLTSYVNTQTFCSLLVSNLLHRLLFDTYLLIDSEQFLYCLSQTSTTLPYPRKLKFAEPFMGLFVTINSATNIIVYTALSGQFRKECGRLFQGICGSVVRSGYAVNTSKAPTSGSTMPMNDMTAPKSTSCN